MKLFLLILASLLLCSCAGFRQSQDILNDLTATTRALGSRGGK